MSYTYQGESRKQNVMSFTNPEVFKKVQELTGQTVEVELTKNDKGYSEWKSIAVGTAAPAGNTTTPGNVSATRVSGSNYETKEERAARQVLIVKQSSLAQAVELTKLANPKGGVVDLAEVKRVAQDLADWVFNTDEDNSIEGMKDDIPF